MTRSLSLIAIFAILFLFFAQMAGTLIESIYILDLMNTTLDARVLGVLFFFSPAFLLVFPRRFPGWLAWVAFACLLVGRGFTPYLNTSGWLLSAGVAVSGSLLLIPLLLREYLSPGSLQEWLLPAQGLGLAVGVSVLLRTINSTIDLSLDGVAWIGWALGLGIGTLLAWVPPARAHEPQRETGRGGAVSGSVALASILTLACLAFFSPGVIARWTEGSYILIITMVSLLSLGWVFFSMAKPGWTGSIRPAWLVAWNLLFTLALTGLILSHTVRFPAAPGSPPVVVGPPSLLQHILLIVMLLLFPVIFVDFALFAGKIVQAYPTPRRLGAGWLLGMLFFLLLVFMNIFSNVWGYVPPVSTLFRNTFWLPFLLMTGLQTALLWQERSMPGSIAPGRPGYPGRPLLLPGVILPGILVCTIAGALRDELRLPPEQASSRRQGNSLRVMTYNIQQANDGQAEKSYPRQLALIRKVSPDLLALQESDSARISLNNNDYVRYYASRLGYHDYYGPRTVTGTFGTAILSRYPLENPQTFFTYSNQDEIGVAQAEIVVAGRRFTIFNVHPDGSEAVKMAFVQALLARAQGKDNVILLGDFNLRGREAPYQLINRVYKNAWMEAYPSGVNPDGLDMSGENRIDHIFFSPGLDARDPAYRLPPESATDHPAHWADIVWK